MIQGKLDFWWTIKSKPSCFTVSTLTILVTSLCCVIDSILLKYPRRVWKALRSFSFRMTHRGISGCKTSQQLAQYWCFLQLEWGSPPDTDTLSYMPDALLLRSFYNILDVAITLRPCICLARNNMIQDLETVAK